MLALSGSPAAGPRGGADGVVQAQDILPACGGHCAWFCQDRRAEEAMTAGQIIRSWLRAHAALRSALMRLMRGAGAALAFTHGEMHATTSTSPTCGICRRRSCGAGGRQRTAAHDITVNAAGVQTQGCGLQILALGQRLIVTVRMPNQTLVLTDEWLADSPRWSARRLWVTLPLQFTAPPLQRFRRWAGSRRAMRVRAGLEARNSPKWSMMGTHCPRRTAFSATPGRWLRRL